MRKYLRLSGFTPKLPNLWLETKYYTYFVVTATELLVTGALDLIYTILKCYPISLFTQAQSRAQLVNLYVQNVRYVALRHSSGSDADVQ